MLKEELELKKGTIAEDSKLVKLKEKFEDIEIEAKRRDKVVETKVSGAAIEMIDRLRDELKSRENFLEEIKNLNKKITKMEEDISQIKGLLRKLSENNKSGFFREEYHS